MKAFLRRAWTWVKKHFTRISTMVVAVEDYAHVALTVTTVVALFHAGYPLWASVLLAWVVIDLVFHSVVFYAAWTSNKA